MLSWEYPPRIVGGLGRHVHELSTALAERGVELHVITCGDETCRAYDKQGLVNVVRADPSHLSGEDFLAWVMGLNFAMVEKGIELMSRVGDFAVIHAHDWLVAFAAETLKKGYHVPLISTIHATEWGRNKGLHNDVQRYISSVEWRLAYESWRVICCSKFMFGELSDVFRVPPDKLRVVPNGVRRGEFAASPSDAAADAEFRKRWAAPEERIVFYIGRLVHEKGVDTLIDAIPKVLAARNAAKFIIAGTGPAAEHLKGRARLLGIADRVYFAGFIDDKTRARLMRLAEMAVFPSLYEPFGIVALEAMAAGRPVVVSDVGGLGEIVTHGVNGFKCYPGDANSLASTILEVLSKPRLAAQAAARALDDAVTIYNWASIARRTEQIYEEVVAESSDTPWVRQARPLELVGAPRHDDREVHAR